MSINLYESVTSYRTKNIVEASFLVNCTIDINDNPRCCLRVMENAQDFLIVDNEESTSMPFFYVTKTGQIWFDSEDVWQGNGNSSVSMFAVLRIIERWLMG